MKLALSIYDYFPWGGLQRDCRQLLTELIGRGHCCRLYCRNWRGDALDGLQVRRVSVRGVSNHKRDEAFQRKVLADLAADPVDLHIGFNPMPGLDFYFAGDGSFIERAASTHGAWYRATPRYRQRARSEAAVFAPAAGTRVLFLNEGQRDEYRRHHAVAEQRSFILPPGVDPARRAPPNADALRKAMRASLALARDELALLFVASQFHNKGLDRAIAALAHLTREQPALSARLLVVGADSVGRFRRLAKKSAVAADVHFLGPREDVRELMLAADLLLHPARVEAGGIVLLEALATGLPVVASGCCGYVRHIELARAGIVLPRPFRQEDLNRAVLRNIDGIFRADRRESALAYAERADLYSLHRTAAELIERQAPERGGSLG